MKRVVYFVQNSRLELVQFISAPPEADLLLHLQAKACPLATGRCRRGLQLLQQRGHPALFVTHGVTHDLSRMGGEHQADVEILQQGLQMGRRHVEMAQPLEQFAEGCRFGLAGEGRSEGIDRLRVLLGAAHTRQIAVFLDPLLEDVHQLEIQGEGACRRDGLDKIHLADQLGDCIAADGSPIAGDRVAELFHSQQPFGLVRRTFAPKNGFPEVFDQGQAVLQKVSATRIGRGEPRPVALWGLGRGREHRGERGVVC